MDGGTYRLGGRSWGGGEEAEQDDLYSIYLPLMLKEDWSAPWGNTKGAGYQDSQRPSCFPFRT